MNETNRFSGILVNDYGDLLRAWPHSESMHQEMADKIEKNYNSINRGHNKISRTMYVIEIGSGRGEATKPILESTGNTIIRAIDASQIMCKQLRKNLSKYIVSGRLNVSEEDAFEYLRFAPQEYDVCASAWTLHNFPRKDRTDLLRLMNRKLTKNGLFVMMDKVLSDNPEVEKQSLERGIKTYDFLLREGKRNAYDAIVAHEKQDHQNPYALRRNEFAKDLTSAGFYDIKFGKRHPLDPSKRDVIVTARKK